MRTYRVVFFVAGIVMLYWMFNLSVAIAETPYSIEWIRQQGSSTRDDSRGLAMDGSGNTFIGGNSRGNIGDVNNGDIDMYLMKYDSNGSPVWSRMFGTETSEYRGAVAADANGNAYLAGETWGDLGLPNNGPPADAVVAKFGLVQIRHAQGNTLLGCNRGRVLS